MFLYLLFKHFMTFSTSKWNFVPKFDIKLGLLDLTENWKIQGRALTAHDQPLNFILDKTSGPYAEVSLKARGFSISLGVTQEYGVKVFIITLCFTKNEKWLILVIR